MAILWEGYTIKTKNPDKLRAMIDEEMKKAETNLKLLKSIIIEKEEE